MCGLELVIYGGELSGWTFYSRSTTCPLVATGAITLPQNTCAIRQLDTATFSATYFLCFQKYRVFKHENDFWFVFPVRNGFAPKKDANEIRLALDVAMPNEFFDSKFDWHWTQQCQTNFSIAKCDRLHDVGRHEKGKRRKGKFMRL